MLVDGVRILGCTLWSFIKPEQKDTVCPPLLLSYLFLFYFYLAFLSILLFFLLFLFANEENIKRLICR